jgi:outer membrane protein assembly factor BamB
LITKYLSLFIIIMVMLPQIPVEQAIPTPATDSTELSEQTTNWPTLSGNFQRHASVSQELALDNGKLNLKWKRFLGERIEVEMQPLVVENLVYIGVMNGKLYALDRETGNTEWVYDAGMGITNTPTIAQVKDKRFIFFGATSGQIIGLDAETGEERWVYQTGGPILSTPSFHDNTLYVGSLDHYFYALDASTGALKWKFESSAPIANTSALSSSIQPDQATIFFASGDNVAYALSISGDLVWKQHMGGAYTKHTQAVFAEDTVIFLTRKAGREYSEHVENIPAILQEGERQPSEIVLDAWADYYLQYPLRRTLYFFDAQTGEDRWQPKKDKTAYVPLYIPYWGQISPVIDAAGGAWFPASGGGGDGGLDHDLRLWKLDLSSGGYTQIAGQDQFLHRFDETGRATLAGSHYYTTISEDIGYYDTTANIRNSRVFGNGFSSHRAPLEFSEQNSTEILGGMEKHFPRFAGSTPGGFAGAADSPSPLIIAGDEAFFTTWGYIYALTSEPVQPRIDHGVLDLSAPPTTSLTRKLATQMLNSQIEAIVMSDLPIQPASRLWSWGNLSPGSFWHSGEVIRSLVDTLPFLEDELALRLKDYLNSEVVIHLLDDRYYEYRYACIDFDTQSILDPCPQDARGISTGWFWTNQNLTSERLYALYRYALVTEDWGLIVQYWNFIRDKYAGFYEYWDEEAGFFLFPEWQTSPFKPSTQMAAAYAVQEMADYVNDSTTQKMAAGHLERMQAARVEWGRYVRSLYDAGELQRINVSGWEEIGYDPKIQIIPVEGYLDQDNDFRQIYRLYRDEENLRVEYAAPRNEIYPYHLVGYHPIIKENASLIREHLSDELSAYIRAIEMVTPFWYMGDYNHAAIIAGHEEDSLSPLAATDIFLAKAYIFNCSFDELAPYLPWSFENYQEWDVFRIQTLTALLSASSDRKEAVPGSVCASQEKPKSKEESGNAKTVWRNSACYDMYCCYPQKCTSSQR